VQGEPDDQGDQSEAREALSRQWPPA
jgi:hypothetical protein